MTKQELESMVGQRVYWWDDEYEFKLKSFVVEQADIDQFCGDNQVIAFFEDGFDQCVNLNAVYANPTDCISNQIAIHERELKFLNSRVAFMQSQLDRFKGMLAYAKEDEHE